MFKKPFKIKSQIQLKSTEKKKFGNDIQALFPALSSDQVSLFNNSKDDIVKMKIVAFTDEIVDVYLVEKIPMFFEIVDQQLKIPTIYMCWKYPEILTTFTTNAFVLKKLLNGADLFLPGVELDTVAFENSDFKAKDIGAVNLSSNSAIVAVGECLMSKSQASLPDASMLGGRLLKIYHTVGDYLCKSAPQPMPSWDPPHKVSDVPVSQETESPESLEDQLESLEVNEEPVEPSQETRTPLEPPSEDTKPKDEREKMDELIEYCFLKAIKTAPKTIYPILPAAFYANHMLPAVPEGETLNVKKTKWKKLTPLLQEMAGKGVVQLETVRANEFRLTGANLSNPIVREFVDPHHTPISVEPAPAAGASVQEVFVVSSAAQPLFIACGRQKGDEMTRLEVRASLMEYINRENLAVPGAADKVRVNEVLRSAIRAQEGKAPESLSRVDLLAGVLAAMPLRHKVSAGGGVVVHKANLPLVEFEVVTRSGNKKVTIISNTEVYGVDVPGFAKSLQHAAAASTSVSNAVPGKKGPQVQVQGNQIRIAAKLLTESYGLHEKFMRGLEKAPKPKKK